MNQRNNWTFRFDARTLSKAAKEKIEHHEGRLRFWESELEKADISLRETGVEFRETPHVNNSYSTTMQNVQVIVDPQKQAHLSNCQTKVRDHQFKVHDYGTFLRAFETNPRAELDLTVEDMEFFGL